MILDASRTDNINNFTAAGKVAQKTAAENAGTKLISDTSTFIKLLTTQLKNQDPTKPLETNEITQQIASLSTVEQGIATNKNLEKLLTAFGQSQTSNAVSYIGKYVEAPGSFTALQGGQATAVYNLAADAADVKITIADTKGNVVYSADGTKLAGRNTFAWDGKNNDGVRVADGTYTFSIKAKDDLAKVVKAVTSSFGRVTSVETVADSNGLLQNHLALGDVLVPLDKVISVRT